MFDEYLQQLIPDLPNQLYQAARYALFPGGKRIRPSLLITIARMFDVQIEKALGPASAIELIHTYSLIHDDLPCMDDDAIRRGKPSLHCAFSEDLAILTGDYLLTLSFEVLADDPSLTDQEKVSLISILARRSGGQGMIAGQVADITNQSISSYEDLQLLHLRKTADLFIAATEMGSIIAGVSASDQLSLANFGTAFGLAFQAVDDIEDHQTDDPLAPSIVNLLGKGAQREAFSLLDQAHDSLKTLSVDASLLIEFIDQIAQKVSC